MNKIIQQQVRAWSEFLSWESLTESQKAQVRKVHKDKTEAEFPGYVWRFSPEDELIGFTREDDNPEGGVTIRKVALELIRPSKTNPRKHFAEGYIAELAESMKVIVPDGKGGTGKRGILQPLHVRPDWCVGKSDVEISQVNGNAPAPAFFEIIAGECRYRGATKAELPTAPVIVMLVSDQEALEIQLIENLQRADLDVFEEAEGYQQLLNLRDAQGAPVHTVETIRLRLNKPRQRIYYRLKLLRAPVSVRKAVLDKTLSVEIAEAIGGIPMPELREQAAAEILKPEHEPGPLTVRRAREVIAEHYVKSLAGAIFDLKDETLVPVIEDRETGERIGGLDCVSCPMRTGNMEAIIGKTKRPDVCTNPACYRLKCDAQFARLQATASAEGKRLLTEAEAAEIFEADGSIWFDSPYVKLGEKIDINDAINPPAQLPTWKKLLENVESKPQIVIGRDPKGRIIEMVDRGLAIEAVKLAAQQRGEKSIFEATAKSASQSASTSAATDEEPEWKKQERRNREIAKLNFEITLAAMEALGSAIDKKGAVKGIWPTLIKAALTHAGHDGCWLICKLHGLDPKAGKRVDGVASEGVEGAALEYGLSLEDEKWQLGFLVELLISQRVKIYNSGSLGGIRSVECFKSFAKLYGVDLDAVEKTVKSKNAEAKKAAKSAKPAKGQSDIKAAPMGTIEHQWDRKLHTGYGEGVPKFKCKRCGATGSQIGTTWPPVVDKKHLEKPCVEKKSAAKKTVAPKRAKSGLTTAAREKLAAAMKKRWAARRKKGGAKK